MSMEIGIFDHLDRGNKQETQFYRERLRIAEAFEQAGFYSYHFAEHHFTPIGMSPSPSVFAAALAERTTKLRFGPMVYPLPLYQPLRLIQEICMVDHLSEGRFDVGFGRGSSKLEAAYYGQDTSQELYAETLELILQALQTDRLTFHGKYFTYDDVPMQMHPYQKPYPPLWYGVHSIESTERAARAGINMISADSNADTRSYHDHYRKIWRRDRGTAPLPKLGLMRFVLVADSDERAMAIAERAYASWHASFHWMSRFHHQVPRGGERARDYRTAIEQGKAIAGSPETVADYLADQLALTRANYFVGQFAFGDLTLDETLKSVELFKDRVAPALQTAEWMEEATTA
jgi:alkanesulfonate monooxygenase SsuD/methylene tetrahydromethanopterin reductase-like flavin-dependent oxidoreductase (luciferase family)